MVRVEVVGYKQNLDKVKANIFGNSDVEILPFDLERLADLPDGIPHIWHGVVNGRTGVYATRRGDETETHLVME